MFMKNFLKNKHLFDLSNYPKDSKFFDSANEVVIAKVKDKFKRIPINKLVGLKSKMYCIVSKNDEEVNTEKE